MTTSADPSPRQGVVAGLLSAIGRALAGPSKPATAPVGPVLTQKETPPLETTGNTAVPVSPAPTVVQKVEGAIEGAVQKVQKTAAEIWGDIETGVTILKDEGEKIVGWVDTNVPGAAGAIQSFVVEAEQDAASLARTGANGLQTQITNGAADAETLVANYLQGAGLVNASGNAAGDLSHATIALAQTTLTQMVNVGLAKVLGAFAPAL